jgi:hypothetical protein
VPVVLVDELEDVELVDVVPDVALVPEVASAVTPICESACVMESTRPPPGGGGTSAVVLDASVTDCVLELLLEASCCASQLLRLETLPMVMSISVQRK